MLECANCCAGECDVDLWTPLICFVETFVQVREHISALLERARAKLEVTNCPRQLDPAYLSTLLVGRAE